MSSEWHILACKTHDVSHLSEEFAMRLIERQVICHKSMHRIRSKPQYGIRITQIVSLSLFNRLPLHEREDEPVIQDARCELTLGKLS